MLFRSSGFESGSDVYERARPSYPTEAVDLLAAADAKALAIVGTGPIAEAHLRHVLPLRPWETIRITSRRIAERPFKIVGARKNAPSPTRRLMMVRLIRSSAASERPRSAGR